MTRDALPSCTALAWAVILGCLSTSTAAADEGSRILSQIIDGIRQHEHRYQTLELRCEVRWAFRGQWQEGEYDSYHIVHQDEAYLVRQTRSHRAATQNEAGEQEVVTQVTVHEVACDGTGTRILAPNGTTNYVHRRLEMMPAFHPITGDPYTCLGSVCRGYPGPSLADFLAEATRQPAAPHTDGRESRLQASYIGEAKLEELACHKIRIKETAANRPQPVAHWDYWIAPTRNYLPVRVTHTAPNLNESLAYREAYYRDLREIAPGLWYPFEVHDIEYDAQELQRKRTQSPRMQQQCQILDVVSEPQYAVDFFRTIEVPEDIIAAAVAQPRIAQPPASRNASSPPQEAADELFVWWRWPPVYMFALILVGIAVMAFRRSRRG